MTGPLVVTTLAYVTMAIKDATAANSVLRVTTRQHVEETVPQTESSSVTLPGVSPLIAFVMVLMIAPSTGIISLI